MFYYQLQNYKIHFCHVYLFYIFNMFILKKSSSFLYVFHTVGKLPKTQPHLMSSPQCHSRTPTGITQVPFPPLFCRIPLHVPQKQPRLHASVQYSPCFPACSVSSSCSFSSSFHVCTCQPSCTFQSCFQSLFFHRSLLIPFLKLILILFTLMLCTHGSFFACF